MKFGGTSVRNAVAIKNVSHIIRDRQEQRPLVVLSAVAGVTDLLEASLPAAASGNWSQVESILEQLRQKHDSIMRELHSSKPVYDFVHAELEKLRVLLSATESIRVSGRNISQAVLSIGELLSTRILTDILRQNSIDAVFVDARKLMIARWDRTRFIPDTKQLRDHCEKQLHPLLNDGKLIVVQGYIASTPDGAPATLGRNGSDYSAALFGAALRAKEIQIWTDTSGILSADPSILPQAQPLAEMSFAEASELAYFGAKVLHPSAIQPAVSQGIPVRVLNSGDPRQPGTLILREKTVADNSIVKSIAYKENITLLTVRSGELFLSPEILARFFNHLTEHDKKVFAVHKSATMLSLTVENADDLPHIIEELNHGSEVSIEKGKAIVSVVGEKLCEDPHLPGQIIGLLESAGVKPDILSHAASQISLLFIIEEKDIEVVVKLLHRELVEKYPG